MSTFKIYEQYKTITINYVFTLTLLVTNLVCKIKRIHISITIGVENIIHVKPKHFEMATA